MQEIVDILKDFMVESMLLIASLQIILMVVVISLFCTCNRRLRINRNLICCLQDIVTNDLLRLKNRTAISFESLNNRLTTIYNLMKQNYPYNGNKKYDNTRKQPYYYNKNKPRQDKRNDTYERQIVPK